MLNFNFLDSTFMNRYSVRPSCTKREMILKTIFIFAGDSVGQQYGGRNCL